jgi:hypothetical protein
MYVTLTLNAGETGRGMGFWERAKEDMDEGHSLEILKCISGP